MSTSLSWYARRLTRMSTREVVSAGRRRGPSRGAGPRPHGAHGRTGRGAADRAPLPLTRAGRRPASRVLPHDAAAMTRSADRLLAGRWSTLGTERTDLRDPDWFLDPSSGTRAPQSALAFRIDHRDEAVTGNVKLVWELSRHHHLTVLACAYWLTGEEEYADAVARQLRSWWAANPVLARRALDQRHRARRTAGLVGLGASPARRLAGGARAVRGGRDGAAPDPLAPGAPGRLPQPGQLGQQPRRRRGRGPAGGGLRLPLVRGERPVAGRGRSSSCAGTSAPTPSPAGSTASRPATTTASSPSWRCSQPWRHGRPGTRRTARTPLDWRPAWTPQRRSSTARAPAHGTATATRGAVCCSPIRPRTPGSSCWDWARPSWARCPGGRGAAAVWSARWPAASWARSRPPRARVRARPDLFPDAGLALLRTPQHERPEIWCRVRRGTARLRLPGRPRPRRRAVAGGPPRRRRRPRRPRHLLLPRGAAVAALLPLHRGAQHHRGRRLRPVGAGRPVPVDLARPDLRGPRRGRRPGPAGLVGAPHAGTRAWTRGCGTAGR